MREGGVKEGWIREGQESVCGDIGTVRAVSNCVVTVEMLRGCKY
jgi:hypothetical protein